MSILCVACTVLRPSGTPRAPQWPRVCEGCRAHLRAALSGLSDALASLSVERGSGRAERVSGTPDPPIPLRLDVVDLTSAARVLSLTIAGLQERDDQIGDVAVASVLDTWVRDWITYRSETHLPVPTVSSLTGWLLVRLDWACDEHPAIDDFAAEVTATVRAVRAAAHTGAAGEKVGRCPSVLRDDSRCGCTLRADPYMNRITCPRCAVSWNRDTGGWLRLAGEQERMSAA